MASLLAIQYGIDCNCLGELCLESIGLYLNPYNIFVHESCLMALTHFQCKSHVGCSN